MRTSYVIFERSIEMLPLTFAYVSSPERLVLSTVAFVGRPRSMMTLLLTTVVFTCVFPPPSESTYVPFGANPHEPAFFHSSFLLVDIFGSAAPSMWKNCG